MLDTKDDTLDLIKLMYNLPKEIREQVSCHIGFERSTYFSTRAAFQILENSGEEEIILTNACHNKNLGVISWICKYKPKYMFDQISELILEYNMKTIEYLVKYHFDYFNEELFNKAASSSQDHTNEMITFLHKHGCKAQGDIIDKIEHQELSTIKLLYSYEYKYSSEAIYKSITHGNYDIMLWLFENYAEDYNLKIDPDDINWHINSQNVNEYLKIYKWLCDNKNYSPGVNEYSYFIKIAATFDELELFKWIYIKIADELKILYEFLLEYDCINIVKWLRENDPTISMSIESATRNPHLNNIKWLYNINTNGCISYVVKSIQNKGHRYRYIDLKFWNNHDKRYERKSDICKKTLEWLEKKCNNCCIIRIIEYAEKNNQLDIANWLKQAHNEACMNKFIYYGENRNIAKILNEFTIESIMEELPQIDSFYQDRYRTICCTLYAMHYAVIKDHLDIIKYLFDIHTTKYQHKIVEYKLIVLGCLKKQAEKYNRKNILEWINEHNKVNITIDLKDA